MIFSLQYLKDWVLFGLKRQTLYGIHSPFLYHFAENCLYKKTHHSDFDAIEEIRNSLKHDQTVISFKDPGAGSRIPFTKSNETTHRKVSSITKHSVHPLHFGSLFYQIAVYIEARSVLELGTSLGITTAYISLAGASTRVDTIEGAEPVAHIAESVFSKLERKNITLHKGKFSEILPSLLTQRGNFDMVLIDGDHNGQNLLNYFNLIVKHIPDHGVLILDDIRWSSSMYKAWNEIKHHHEVTLCLDLFKTGIVFKNPDLSKQVIKLKF